MGKTIVEQQALSGSGTTYDYGRGDNYPIYWVSWYDAIVFCNKLSIMKGLNPVYSIGGSTDPANWGPVPVYYANATWDAAVMDKSKNGYRLPTEEEWEYACRGDYPNKATEKNTKPFGIGDGTKMTSGMANFYCNKSYDLALSGEYDAGGTYLDKTTAVGSYAPNNYGLYDMHGNVYEYCWDWYYNGPGGDDMGSVRIMRGGGFDQSGKGLRSAFRDSFLDPANRFNYSIGFRVVRFSDDGAH